METNSMLIIVYANLKSYMHTGLAESLLKF